MSLILPYIENNNHDRFGFYSVGQIRTYSKYQALELHKATGLSVQWNFNEKEFSSLDWTIPGEQSLEVLYRTRAQQLREKYDYLVVAYSGGADSHNILMSFIKNNIHIDEIMTIVELDGDRDPMSYSNAEITKVAYPTAKDLIERYQLKTKHSVVDVTEIVLNLWQWLTEEEWVHFLKYHYSPINFARSFICEKVSSYRELFDKGLKVGFVWGIDKPHVIGLNNKIDGSMAWAAAFSDRTAGSVPAIKNHRKKDWENDEYFYWSPDLPELVRAQAHVVMDYMKCSQNNIYKWSVGADASDSGCFLNGRWIYLKKDIIHALIYPHWDPTTFSLGKPVSSVFGNYTRWLYKDKSHPTMQLFLAAVRKLQSSPGWRGATRGIGACWSRLYPLEKISNLGDWEVNYPY